MDQEWKLGRLVGVMVACLLCMSLRLTWCLNDEGLALLRFRERVMSDPFGALSNWKDEDGVVDPCSWFGIECSDGKVVALNLKGLCLGGTLGPELAKLVQIKSIILRNNSFSGIIPEEIGELKELEELDLGYNNFCGTLPAELGSNLSLTILLVDNNEQLGNLSPEIDGLQLFSESQVDENQLSNAAKGSSCHKRCVAWSIAQNEVMVQRRLLQRKGPGGEPLIQSPSPPALKAGPPTTNSSSPSPNPAPTTTNSSSPSPNPAPTTTNSSSPSPNPAPTTTNSSSPSPNPAPTTTNSSSPSPNPAPTTTNSSSPSPNSAPTTTNSSSPSPNSAPTTTNSSSPSPNSAQVPSSPKLSSSHSNIRLVLILVGAIGGAILISIIGVYLCKTNKVATVKPWATGLSGQLQKAFVTGVPKLKRSELETACEDFSNVIGSSPIGIVHKGTLSSGVEIAVASVAVTSAKDWSISLEAQFRKKIDTISKVNHKNFVNLLGFCEEDEPFTRMMVFEYAPNGTLFEHLHIKEAEHLDWRMRLRIAMGMAYCLEHMHQLNPPIAHNNLNSSAVCLTEDYAAKISEFSFWNEIVAAKIESAGLRNIHTPSVGLESNVYSFGVILFEMVTGRVPYSVDSSSLEDWASDFLRGEQPLREIVDPTLTSFQEVQLELIGEVIKSCVHPDPKHRPAMREVSARFRAITGITPEGANPKLSPLWWAELEVASADGS